VLRTGQSPEPGSETLMEEGLGNVSDVQSNLFERNVDSLSG
jgi:hypothetical protein